MFKVMGLGVALQVLIVSASHSCDRQRGLLTRQHETVCVGPGRLRWVTPGYFSSCQRNVYAKADMNAACLLSAAPPCPPSTFS